MSQALSGALPRPQKTARAAETTPGGQESVRWVAVAQNLQPLEANVIKARLESMDIPALVHQESIGSVMGLTVGPLGAARVLVPEPLAGQSLEILAQTFEPADDETDGKE
ncbi:MAG: putative signal transducing protein [Anaerolineae bacterium]